MMRLHFVLAKPDLEQISKAAAQLSRSKHCLVANGNAYSSK
jgi:hypothetical protein